LAQINASNSHELHERNASNLVLTGVLLDELVRIYGSSLPSRITMVEALVGHETLEFPYLEVGVEVIRDEKILRHVLTSLTPMYKLQRKDDKVSESPIMQTVKVVTYPRGIINQARESRIRAANSIPVVFLKKKCLEIQMMMCGAVLPEPPMDVFGEWLMTG